MDYTGGSWEVECNWEGKVGRLVGDLEEGGD